MPEPDFRAASRDIEQHLDVPEFADGRLVPTGENLARFVFERVQAALGDAVRVVEVTVAEDETLRCTYRGGDA